MDETARAIDEALGATRNGVHGRKDELLVGHVVNEEEHPGTEGFERRHVGREALARCREFFHFGTVDGFNQSVAGWKMTIERA